MTAAIAGQTGDTAAFVAHLQFSGVTGEVIDAALAAQQASAAAAAAWHRAHVELVNHGQVGEAYAANPGAGSKEFVTADMGHSAVDDQNGTDRGGQHEASTPANTSAAGAPVAPESGAGTNAANAHQEEPAGPAPAADPTVEDRNTLGIGVGSPDLQCIVSSTFLETDPDTGVGIAYAVDASDPADPYIWLTVGSRDEAIRQMNPWPKDHTPTIDEDNVACLDDETTTKLGRRLQAAAKAAETGREFPTKTVNGSDCADIEVEAVGDHVRITVVPYGLDEPYEEPFTPEPLTEVETDDGELREPTDEELADWMADERATYDAEVADHEAAQAARRQQLTTFVSPSQARQLRAGLLADLKAAATN